MKKLLVTFVILVSMISVNASTVTSNISSEKESFNTLTLSTDVLRNIYGLLNLEVKTNIKSSTLIGVKYINYSIESDDLLYKTNGYQAGVNLQYHFNKNIKTDGWITRISYDQINFKTAANSKDSSDGDAYATATGSIIELLGGYQWVWGNLSSHLLLGSSRLDLTIDARSSSNNIEEKLTDSTSSTGLGLSYGFSYSF